MRQKTRHLYTKELLAQAVSRSKSWGDVVRSFGLPLHGGTRDYIKKRALKWEINFSHFVGYAWNKGLTVPNHRLTPKEILIVYPAGRNRQHAYLLRRALLESGIEKKCEICGNRGIWNDRELTLEIDHIDGNPLNCLQNNLRQLCPNCHSQTENYKSKKLIWRGNPIGDGSGFENLGAL